MRSIVIHPDIAQAQTLPSWFYTDPTVFEWTKDHLFAQTWQFSLEVV